MATNSSRFTEKDAKAAFNRLLEATGQRWAKSYNDVGGWQLDHNPTYGGIVAQRVFNEHGAVAQPLGYQRHTPREFCQAIYFALDVLQQMKVEAAS